MTRTYKKTEFSWSGDGWNPKTGPERVETTENRQSQFSPKLAIDAIPFTDSLESVSATVEEGDTRTLKTVGEAVEAYEDYLRAKENQRLVLTNEKTGDLLVIPYNHRWTDDYRRLTYAKLKAAERHVQREWGEIVPTTLLTFTAPHNNPDGSPRAFCDVLDDLKAGWSKARNIIRHETEGTRTEVLTVYEPHETGYPHLHVLIFGIARPSLGEKLTSKWAEAYVNRASVDAQNCSIKNGREAQIESPAAYVMKYLSKSLVRESEQHNEAVESLPTIGGYREFSAMMWATGSRQYTMSEGLSTAVKAEAPSYESEGSWTFLGAASGLDLGLYDGDEATALSSYLRGSRRNPTPPRKERIRNQRLPPP